MKSILAILEKEGVDSEVIKKINESKEILDDPILENKEYKLIDVVDNRLETSNAVMSKCFFCNGETKYEHHLLNKKTNKIISAGSNCACEALNIYDFQTKGKYNKLTAGYLKQKQWKMLNPEINQKLERIKVTNHPYFKVFANAIKQYILSADDIQYINQINIKAIENDQEYIEILEGLLSRSDVKPKEKEIIKSLYGHVCEGKYLSQKQKDLISSLNEQEKVNYIVAVHNAFKFVKTLKQEGYIYDKKFKVWHKVVTPEKLKSEKVYLAVCGIKPEQITISPKND